MLLSCLRDKAKIALFQNYFDLRPPNGQTAGQNRGEKTRPLGQLKCANPRGSPGGGWSGLELTDTLMNHELNTRLSNIKHYSKQGNLHEIATQEDEAERGTQ